MPSQAFFVVLHELMADAHEKIAAHRQALLSPPYTLRRLRALNRGSRSEERKLRSTTPPSPPSLPGSGR